MKIAIIHPKPLTPGTIDLAAYVRRFTQLGHESLLVTSRYLRGPTDISIAERSMEEMVSPATWRKLGIDVAITFLWFHEPQITEAIAAAGCRVVARADVDGQQSIRVFPAHFYRCMVSAWDAPRRKLREFRSFIHRYLIRYETEDQDILRSIAACESIAIETTVAARNLASVLDYYNRPDLKHKIVVVPHCVDDVFLLAPIAEQRSPNVVSIGRWQSPQKNPAVLREVIRRELEQSTATRFVVIGPGATSLCGDLALRSARVDCYERVSQSDIPSFLAGARVLLSTSRWEGSPISGNEALASGCSIVGTPIPGFTDIVNQGPFGTISTNHSHRALRSALTSELEAWDRGRRSPKEIAEYWRPRVSQSHVMQKLLSAAYRSEHHPRSAGMVMPPSFAHLN